MWAHLPNCCHTHYMTPHTATAQVTTTVVFNMQHWNPENGLACAGYARCSKWQCVNIRREWRCFIPITSQVMHTLACSLLWYIVMILLTQCTVWCMRFAVLNMLCPYTNARREQGVCTKGVWEISLHIRINCSHIQCFWHTLQSDAVHNSCYVMLIQYMWRVFSLLDL